MSQESIQSGASALAPIHQDDGQLVLRSRAWREPMFYLVCLLPCLSLVVLGLLLVLARPSSNEVDPIARMAQIQTRADGGQHKLSARGLQALVRPIESNARARLEVQLVARTAEAEPIIATAMNSGLMLMWLHPTDAAQDRSVRLQLQAGTTRWAADLSAVSAALAKTAHWRLRLFPVTANCQQASTCLAQAPWQLYGDTANQRAGSALKLFPSYADGP